MLPYVLIGLATPLAAKIGTVRGLRALWWALPAGLLVLFSGLRGPRIGTDVPMYQAFFALIDPTSYANSLDMVDQEPGFVALMFLTRQFTDDFTTFLVICAALTIYPVLIAVRRLSTMPAFSVFLFVTLSYYPLSFNVVRQSIASSLVFLAESYRYERRWLWLLLTAVAPLVHISALLASIVIFFARLSRIRLVPLLVISATVALVGYPVARIPAVTDLLSRLNDRYTTYLDNAVGSGLGTVLSLIVHVVIAVFCIVMARRLGRATITEVPYAGLYVLTIPIMAMATSMVVISRLEPYFGIFAILALPQALSALRRPQTWTAIISCLAFVFYVVYIASYGDLIPYQLTGGR